MKSITAIVALTLLVSCSPVHAVDLKSCMSVGDAFKTITKLRDVGVLKKNASTELKNLNIKNVAFSSIDLVYTELKSYTPNQVKAIVIKTCLSTPNE